MNKKLIVLAIAAISGLAAAPVFAGSVGGTGGSTEITQILNNGELMAQLDEAYKQTQIINDTLQKAEDTARSVTRMLPPKEWQKADKSLRDLSKVTRVGREVAYEMWKTENIFKQKFPGYEGMLSGQQAAKGLPQKGFGKRAMESAQTALDAQKAAINAAGYTNDQLASDTQITEVLLTQSRSADGQLKAIQAGNEIAVAVLEELRKMKQLYMQQMTSQAQYQAYVMQKDERAHMSRQYAEDISDEEAQARYKKRIREGRPQ